MKCNAGSKSIQRRLVLVALVRFIAHLKNHEAASPLHKPQRELKCRELVF